MAGPSTGRTFVLPVIIGMRDLEVIDSELRLLAAVRQVCGEQDGVLPSFGADLPNGRGCEVDSEGGIHAR
jgi:hypothetical protein